LPERNGSSEAGWSASRDERVAADHLPLQQ
jgi:hypothetical protein